MKKLILLLFIPTFALATEKFSNGEENFKQALEKIAQNYIDKGLTREDLYRAATAGMLDSLNADKKHWNELLAPSDLQELQADISGRTTGIGVELKFDETTGYGQILNVLAKTPSSKAGLKREDIILSVNGKSYKGKSLEDLARAIRGKTGETVALKILREDQVLSISLKREMIPWTPVELSKVDDETQLLTIGYFTEDAPKLVEEKLKAVNASTAKNLVIDLRGNTGGAFSKAVETAELFIPKGKKIVTTIDRAGKIEEFLSKGRILKDKMNVIVLLNGFTSSGAELFAGAMVDELGAKTIGEKTFGKWNAQSLETLPNGYAVKFTVKNFQTPSGKSFQSVGMKPDIEVTLPKDVSAQNIRLKYDVAKRLEMDSQLKAAVELIRAM